MVVIKSKVDVNSKEFKENYEHYKKMLEKYREICDEVRAGNPKSMK